MKKTVPNSAPGFKIINLPACCFNCKFKDYGYEGDLYCDNPLNGQGVKSGASLGVPEDGLCERYECGQSLQEIISIISSGKTG